MSGRLDQVERALADLWAGQAARGVRARALTSNLVVVCEDAAQLDRARDVVHRVLPASPGRAIVVALREGDGTSITAHASLVPDPSRGGDPCGDLIVLEASGRAAEALPPAVERLRSPGAPVFLWWVGDLPDDDGLYARLADTSDVVAINSEEMDLRDLVKLSQRAVASRGRYALADLNWARLRSWQELLAQFFDDPAVLPKLARARSLTVAFAPPDAGHADEPASTQAGLYAGWFASRVRAVTGSAQWGEPRGGAAEVRMPRAGGGELVVRFERDARDDVFPGALIRVELATDDGAHFKVCRGEDRHVAEWHGVCDGAVIPSAVMRLGLAEDATMLARQLESPARDALFEASLASAARMLAPIYRPSVPTSSPRGGA